MESKPYIWYTINLVGVDLCVAKRHLKIMESPRKGFRAFQKGLISFIILGSKKALRFIPLEKAVKS